jgi:hypothetical protein
MRMWKRKNDLQQRSAAIQASLPQKENIANPTRYHPRKTKLKERQKH